MVVTCVIVCVRACVHIKHLLLKIYMFVCVYDVCSFFLF